MNRLALIASLLPGCWYFGPSDDDSTEPDKDIPPDAFIWPDALEPSYGTCPPDVSLALATDMYKSMPITFDAAGSSKLCIRLDTTAMTHPTYFDARTPYEPGPPAEFALALYDTSDQLLAVNYDAELPSMQTYATVSFQLVTPRIVYVKLLAWSKNGAPSTQLELGLYQILD